jgi:hypothetical protein
MSGNIQAFSFSQNIQNRTVPEHSGEVSGDDRERNEEAELLPET